MPTVNLACCAGHAFEAWFRSRAEFAHQHAAGLVACPWCGVRDIECRPSLPNVARSRDRIERRQSDKGDRGDKGDKGDRGDKGELFPSAAMREFAETLRSFHRYIEQTCDDVGGRFAIEARRRHEEYEGSEEAVSVVSSVEGRRGIYGQATREEVCALEEDGISVAPLPRLPSRHN